VLRLNGSPEKIDEGVEAYKSRVVPALRERDGYSGARLIVDRRTGAAMSISFWPGGATSRASLHGHTETDKRSTRSMSGAAMSLTVGAASR
jgi:hypothetical protein